MRHTIKTNKMKTKILVLVCLLSNFIYAQDKKIVSAFTKLQVSSAVSVYLQKSDTPYVIAYMDAIKISENDNTLALSLNKGNHDDNTTKITVGYTQLNQITVTGASSVKSR